MGSENQNNGNENLFENFAQVANPADVAALREPSLVNEMLANTALKWLSGEDS